jgi:monothiol glutaredoxin
MSIEQFIDNEVKSNDVVLFMKGTPRDGIKTYSNWPTIPQLYVKGEFVGGCDIIREMFQAGELQQLLADKGVTVSAAASA